MYHLPYYNKARFLLHLMYPSFIKSCWNKCISPEDFTKKAKEEFPNDIKEIVNTLLCLRAEFDNMPLIQDYLNQFFVEDALKALSYVDLDNKEHIKACMILFAIYGDSYRRACNASEIDICCTALKIVEICLACEDDDLFFNAFNKISANKYLSICIAGSRNYCPEKCSEVLEKYLKRKNENQEMFSKFTQNNVDYAFCNKPPGWITYSESRIESMFIFGVIFRIYVPRNGSVNFMDTEFYFYLFAQVVNNYFQKPSLVDSFVIIRIAKIISTNAFDYSLTTFGEIYDKEIIVNAVKSIPDDAIMKTGLSKETIIDFFTRTPDQIDSFELIETVIDYPILSSCLSRLIKERIENGTYEEIESIAQQIYNDFDDYKFFLYQTEDIILFSRFLVEMITKERDEKRFEVLLILYLSLVKITWKTGSKKLRHCVLLGFENAAENMKIFISYILNNDIPATHQRRTLHDIENADSCVDRCLFFIEYLFDIKDDDVDGVIQLLCRYKYLWPGLFAWGIIKRSPIALKFTYLKFPDNIVNNIMYFHMTILVIEKHVVLLDFTDFDMVRDLYNKNPFELTNLSLNNTLDVSSEWSLSSRIFDITVSWRVWLDIFGPTKLIEFFFVGLSKNHSFFSYEINDQQMFVALADVILVVCDGNNELLMEMLKVVEMHLNNDDSDEKIESEDYACFCFIVVISMWDKWEERFKFVLDLCRKIYYYDYKPSHLKKSFAVSFLKKAVYIPHLQDKIPLETYKIFMENNDFKTVVDFFFIKSQEKARNK